MTVATTTNRISYTGNGSTTAFSVTFPFYASTDLEVIERVIATGVETTKTLTTDYSVTGGSGSTGTVTAVTAPASTVTWTIRRTVPYTQSSDYTPNDPFPADTLEQDIDRAAMRDQQIKEILDRCLRFPSTDSTSLTSQLTSAIDRASKYVAFDSSGNVTLTSGTDGSQIISAAMEAVVGALTLAAARAAMDVQEDVITTRGDLVKGSSSAVAERLGIGGVNTVLTSDGTDPSWADWRTPRGYIDGFILSNNVADATNDIDIAAGICRDGSDTSTIRLTSGLTKRLDASWAVGTNQGGLDTGSIAANTWYAMWAIRRTDTNVVDVLFSASFSAPTMPANYTQKRIIGAVRTNNSSALYAFTQAGDRCYWKAPTLDVSSTGFSAASTAVTFTLSGTSTQGAPPVEGALIALNLSIYPNAGSGRGIYVYHPSDTGSNASATAAPLASLNNTGSTNKSGGEVLVRTNSSGQIAMRPDDTLANVYAAVIWFTMPRGKDA